jgi:hypothetical protein
MTSNLADESLPGSGQLSELGRSRRFDDVFVTRLSPNSGCSGRRGMCGT